MDTEIRQRFFAALEAEIRLLMDPDTGLVSQRYARHIDCPLCAEQRDSQEKLFIKNGFGFVRCKACGLIFSNPQVKPELLGELYRDSNSSQLWVELQKSATEQAWKTDYYLDAIHLLETGYAGSASPRLLDIGCNTGLFLEICQRHRADWLVQGIELNNSACEYAVSRGLAVEQCQLADLDSANAFDIYTLFGVMEHLTEPHGVLREIKNRIPAGKEALVMAIVPNSYSLYHMMLQDKSQSFDGRDHLLYFSEQTLGRVFEMAGFELVKIDTVLDGLGSIKRQMQWLDPNGTDDTDRYIPESLKALFADGRIEDFIKTNNLGLRLRILARYKAT